MTEQIPEVLKYISEKRTLMSSPGFLLNDVYYNKFNSSVDQVEVTYTQGRVNQGLPSYVFGSSSQITIPFGSLLGDTYLHLELPKVVANQTLPRGWGLKFLSSLNFLFGSSNVTQMSINGETILHLLLSQCETSEKASEMFRLAGEEVLTHLGPETKHSADILLPLPWSSLSALFQVKSFDTTLLNNPITLTVSFNNSSAVYGGSGARPIQFTKAEISYRTGDFTQKSMSLKNTLATTPSMMYSIPWIMSQSFVSQTFQGSSNSNSPVQLQLNNFINADLVGMVISIVKNSDLYPSGGNSPSAFNYDDITNLRLNLNGQDIFYTPESQHKLTNLQSQLGASYFHNSVINPGAIAPFSSRPVDSYPIFINFSRIRAPQFVGKVQNVWRIGSNTMSVSFNTTDNSNYTMFVTNNYTAVTEIGNGESRIYTN